MRLIELLENALYHRALSEYVLAHCDRRSITAGRVWLTSKLGKGAPSCALASHSRGYTVSACTVWGGVPLNKGAR